MVKNRPKIAKKVFLCFSERCHGNMCNLNVIVLLEFISRDLHVYLLFAILLSSKFHNSFFYQHMRQKSDLKFPRHLLERLNFVYNINFTAGTSWLYSIFTSRNISISENILSMITFLSDTLTIYCHRHV